VPVGAAAGTRTSVVTGTARRAKPGEVDRNVAVNGKRPGAAPAGGVTRQVAVTLRSVPS